MDSITKATSNIKISSNSKVTEDEIVDLDSDEDTSTKVVEPPIKRIAKKSTASLSFQQPPAAATRRQVALAKERATVNQDKFLENFNPDSSVRERRKLTRKVNAVNVNTRKVAGALYDENGVHLATGIDLCDCLQKQCSGCHFPCIKCGSQKCGSECRCNRKYVYDQIEYHGCDYIVKNPLTLK